MKRCLLILLTMILLLQIFNGCQKPEPQPEDKPKTYLSLISDGQSDYRFVVPADDTIAYDLAFALANTIHEKTGVRLQVQNDRYAETECEILIGRTNRQASQSVAEKAATPDDYCLEVVGKKVVAFAFSESAVRACVAALSDQLLPEMREGSLSVDETLALAFHSDATYYTLSDASSSQYTIVCESANQALAEKLQATVETFLGVKLPIRDAGEAKTDCEILIGACGRTQGKSAMKALASPMAATVGAYDKTIVLAGSSEASLEVAVSLFANWIKSNIFKPGTVMFRQSFSLSGNTSPAGYLQSINDEVGTLKVASGVETYRVYVPDGTDSAWYYSHHPYVTKFGDNYYVFYSSGRRNEDDVSQRVMMGVSSDFKNWTTSVLVDSQRPAGAKADSVLTCAGVYLQNGKMNVYYFSYDYDESLLRENPDGTPLRPKAETGVSLHSVSTAYYITTEDGVHWSAPVSLGNQVSGNMSPILLEDGEHMIWAGHRNVSYTTDITGTSGWNRSASSIDPSAKHMTDVCESSFYQLSDGTVVMLSRTSSDNLAACVSFDYGVTWSNSYETDFHSSVSKFMMGKLPDGRYFYLGNDATSRNDLYIKISTDGVNFSTWYLLGAGTGYSQQKTGMYKGGGYGYCTYYMDATTLYIVYSLEKEGVEVMKVPLSSLGVKA